MHANLIVADILERGHGRANIHSVVVHDGAGWSVMRVKPLFVGNHPCATNNTRGIPGYNFIEPHWRRPE